jgi:hypothetical protein
LPATGSVASEFKGSHFEPEVILWAVRWYVACPISYRQFEEMMEEHGVEVDHATVLHGGVWGAQDFPAGLKLRNTDGLRASKREHAVEDVDGDRDLGILTSIGLRTQPVADNLLESANRGLHPRSFVVAGSLLPTDTPSVGDAR